ncbi:MAG: serpin family protein [Micropruina sp.]|nr:serpin family protein [Micropruina sp.]
MNRRHLLQAALLGLVPGSLAMTACQAIPSAPKPEYFADAIKREAPGTPAPSSLWPMAVGLLSGLPAGNALVSPLSLANALGMLRNGARGQSAAELDSFFGSSVAALNTELNTLSQTLAAITKGGQATMTSANSIWVKPGIAWKQDFLDELARWYGAGLYKVDFAADPEGAARAINGWVSTATNGLIPTIVDRSLLTPATVSVLANAVHLKGAWTTRFDPSKTADAPFTTSSGTRVTVPMMRGNVKRAFVSTKAWDAALLPLRDESLALALVMPIQGGLKGNPPVEAFQQLLSAPISEKFIAMPRWTFASGEELSGDLKALGVRTIFTPAADFTGMADTPPLRVSFVSHRAFISVNEDGAEAAAGSSIGMAAGASRLVAEFNRAFWYALVHVPTGTPLFLGRLDDPSTAHA